MSGVLFPSSQPPISLLHIHRQDRDNLNSLHLRRFKNKMTQSSYTNLAELVKLTLDQWDSIKLSWFFGFYGCHQHSGGRSCLMSHINQAIMSDHSFHHWTHASVVQLMDLMFSTMGGNS